MGCLIQVNAPSFLDRKEKKLAFALLKNGFVHCIGTDAHNMAERAPNITKAKEAVKNAGLEEMWQRAENIMEDVLADRQVCVEQGKPIKKCFGFYL
jgi:tyrosine-protein phosphatase YwqE